MHIKQDTLTGALAAAIEYFVKPTSWNWQYAADLGITDTVNVTITVDGPYFSSLPAVAGVQPRGLPAEFDLEWIGMNWTLSPYGTDKALSASMTLAEGEGIWLAQEQAIREEFADSTGSYTVRFTSAVEALFVPPATTCGPATMSAHGRRRMAGSTARPSRCCSPWAGQSGKPGAAVLSGQVLILPSPDRPA